MLSPNVERTAKLLRKESEVLAANSDFPMAVDPDDLGGMCGICSAALAVRLTKQRFKVELHQGRFDGNGHCWVVVQGHLVDITATQFKEFRSKPVLILPWVKARKMSYHTDLKMLVASPASAAELGRFFRGWNDDHKPTPARLRKLGVVL